MYQRPPRTSEGGHLALIKAAAKWYGKPSNWYAKQGELERMIHQINEGMENPRPSVEVREDRPPGCTGNKRTGWQGVSSKGNCR